MVGTGIQAGRDLTVSALQELREADKVFYLVADPLSEAFILRENKSAVNLFDCYAPGKVRNESYEEMIRRATDAVFEGQKVCVALYGHPGVFVYPSHEMIKRCRAKGFEAKMLPAISAEDWIFADVGFDPAREGCQSYEATDFLIYRRQYDSRSYLVLWQVGVIGCLDWSEAYEYKKGLKILIDTLCKTYDENHKVILYEASQYVISEPRIERTTLRSLIDIRVSPISTLVVPPGHPSRAFSSVMNEIGIPITNDMDVV